MPESCVYFGKVRDLWNFSLTSRKITVPHQKKKNHILPRLHIIFLQ